MFTWNGKMTDNNRYLRFSTVGLSSCHLILLIFLMKTL